MRADRNFATSRPLPYVEPQSDARTKLADFFNILLTRERLIPAIGPDKGHRLVKEPAEVYVCQ